MIVSLLIALLFFLQPDIPKYSKGYNPNTVTGGPADKDYISYTVSAPSGRGTALFSADGKNFVNTNVFKVYDAV